MQEIATAAARNILESSLRLSNFRNGVAHLMVVTDRLPCRLSQALLDGYRVAADSQGLLLHRLLFEASTFHRDVLELVERVHRSGNDARPEEIVGCVLIQRAAFQNDLKSYRLRLRLFELGLRVAEHAHLGLLSSPLSVADEVQEQEQEAVTTAMMMNYLRSCMYSPTDAKADGEKLAVELDRLVSPASPLRVISRGADASALRDKKRSIHTLQFQGYLEPCVLNTGWYPAADDPARRCVKHLRDSRRALASSSHSSTNNPFAATVGSSIGGTFPIGEVITEAEDLGSVSGRAAVFAFPNTSKRMVRVTPFEISISHGVITDVAPQAPAEFVALLDLIREAEGEAVIRELGIGLNPYLGRQAFVSDVTAFERQLGVHLSVGKRHPLFVKRPLTADAARPLRPDAPIRPVLKRKEGMFHVDIFLDAVRLEVDGRNKPLLSFSAAP